MRVARGSIKSYLTRVWNIGRSSHNITGTKRYGATTTQRYITLRVRDPACIVHVVRNNVVRHVLLQRPGPQIQSSDRSLGTNPANHQLVPQLLLFTKK